MKRADEQIDFTSIVVQVTRNTNRTLAIVVHDRYFDPVFLPQLVLQGSCIARWQRHARHRAVPFLTVGHMRLDPEEIYKPLSRIPGKEMSARTKPGETDSFK
jgi:hypothetical protein